MDGGATDALVRALVVLGLVVALWVAASVPAYIVKLTLGNLGVLAFPKRAAQLAARFAPTGDILKAFFLRMRDALAANSERDVVRVAIDDSHKRLKQQLLTTEAAVRDSVANLEGLGAAGGPATALKDIRDLQERTKLVDAIAVEFDGDLEEAYAAKSRTTINLIFVSLFALIFMVANGLLLNLFFRSMTSVQVAGVPVSLLASIMVVAAEMAMGYGVARFGRMAGGVPAKWLVLAMIVLAAFFEAVVLGLVSNEFDLDLPLLDEHPILKFWMAPLGLVLVTGTSTMGFFLHKSLDELAEHRGVGRLKRELQQAENFVRDLPAKWGEIGQAARQAEASIERYIDALGGQDARIAGAIDALSKERRQLSEAIRAADLDDWSSLVAGAQGDQRVSAAQNLGCFIVSLIALVSYAVFVVLFAAGAFHGRVHIAASIAMGVTVALGFYSLGFLSFQRLELVDGTNGRAKPLRAGPLEYAVACIVALGCATGILWAASTVLGGWGILLGVLLTACGGLLAIAGYFVERAIRGGTLFATSTAAFAIAIVGAVLSVLRYVLIWAVAVLAWVVSAALSLLAAPLEVLLRLIKERGAPQRQPANDVTQIAA